MQSGSYWAFREAAELPDRDDCAPDVRVLWDKHHIARKAHLCGICGEEISIGTRYRYTGLVLDGIFEIQKAHDGYPLANCPRFADQERRELAEQFEEDRKRFFPE